jgi:hypothetical protein
MAGDPAIASGSIAMVVAAACAFYVQSRMQRSGWISLNLF